MKTGPALTVAGVDKNGGCLGTCAPKAQNAVYELSGLRPLTQGVHLHLGSPAGKAWPWVTFQLVPPQLHPPGVHSQPTAPH